MSSQIYWNANTHVGRFRKNNEDAFLALKVSQEGAFRLGKEGEDSLDGSNYIFAVADGMGGAKAGEFASDVVREAVMQKLPTTFNPLIFSADDALALLEVVYQETHSRLTWLGLNYEECRGMGSTLSLCWVADSFAVLAHIGDSRIYHLGAGEALRQLSTDHTHAGWLYKNGELNERAFRGHPMRNALQQALGGDARSIRPQFDRIDFSSDDQLLVCSDGLIEGLWDSGVRRLLRRREDERVACADRLIQESVQVSGRDNTTAVVIARD